MPELDGGTQAKVVMLEGNSSERRSNSRQCKVVNIVKGRDGSWVVAANETIPLASTWDLGEELLVWKTDWGSACHAAACEVSARRGLLRRTHPVLAKKCSALDGMEQRKGNACFGWGKAAKDKDATRRRLVVGELAADASQPLGGGRYRHRIALDGKRTGRRGGVGKETACTYLFVAAGRAEKERQIERRPGGQNDERVRADG